MRTRRLQCCCPVMIWWFPKAEVYLLRLENRQMTSEGNATVNKSSTPSIDPVTLSVVWNAMVAISEEMGVRLRNSAYSAAVREGDDFSTGLFDRHGRLVAQGNFTPGHLGAMPFVLR